MWCCCADTGRVLRIVVLVVLCVLCVVLVAEQAAAGTRGADVEAGWV